MMQKTLKNVRKYKTCLLPILLFMMYISVFSQNAAENVLVLDKIETPSFTISFQYNQQGWVTSETRGEGDNEYLHYKFEYQYDENGNIVLLTKYDIYLIHQEENEYNANNQIVVKNIYEDYGSGLKYVEQHLYTYQDTLLQTILKQMISPNGPVNSTKQEFIYNKEQQLVQITKHDWVMGLWYHTETFDIEYNESGNMVFYADEMLQWEGVFAKIWRYAFHYNEVGELTERNHHNGLDEDWNPRPSRRYRYSYESLTNNETILFPNIYQFDDLNFNWFQSGKKLVLDSLWIADCGGTLYYSESANYLYKPITINDGIDDYKESVDVLVYPNPTTGQLRIRNYELGIGALNEVEVEVFDIYGKHHLSTRPLVHSSTITMDISHLPAGVYFVKIITEKQIITKKILKY